jgi:hypothetical protein
MIWSLRPQKNLPVKAWCDRSQNLAEAFRNVKSNFTYHGQFVSMSVLVVRARLFWEKLILTGGWWLVYFEKKTLLTSDW